MMFGWFCIIFVFFALTQILPVKSHVFLYGFILLVFGVSFILSMIFLSQSMKIAVNYLLMGGFTVLAFGALFEVAYFLMIAVIYFLFLMLYFLLVQRR